jgi:hypothetical protein
LIACAALAQPWPVTEGETLTGKKVALPTVFAGRSVVLVFSFSRNAGEKVRDWLEPLLKEGRDAWSVASLEAAPQLIRPIIRGGMRKDMTPALRERTIVLYKNDKAWRKSLDVDRVKDDAPVLIMLDAAGKPVWRHNGFFDAAVLAQIP